ncbi:hypothetical protein JOF56_009814 [Kibdelosporangium banguiense]|uniref:Tn3 transposase DDE domain-containing protein n=1 Tax=Kibdelosporangium banguiense TaxID=1365924 RepID=A0ABS4TYG0_9PSEU|nr:hypothetical protein [Kibdelosporangium banguiense]MBP2329429.1 hypothetical protein [Kibdelosporangium banguiense]
MHARKEVNEEPDMAPSVFDDLSGHYGLRFLLSVLDREAGWRNHELAASKLQTLMRWNQQCILLAKVVLLGRDGRLLMPTKLPLQFSRTSSSIP